MYACIATVAFVGVEARAVEVQVRITPGAPAFTIVGLPDKAVAESKERVRNALHAVGLGLPYKHLTVILAPAHLLSLVNHFKGLQMLSRPKPQVRDGREDLLDLADVKGQENAKRALEVAAAGGHNILMVGPPGSGKSMLAQRLPSILPPLTPEEMLEVSMVHSLAGELMGGTIVTARPFRAPHHSASMAALVGGGSRPCPGEVSMAHLGVLFLDELPEFSPVVLDSLRQPLESGQTTIARANHRITYPSRIQLVAAMNPCRCGGGAAPGQSCKRGPRCAADYQARISGPLFDRIDLMIEVGAVSAQDLALPSPSEGSAQVRARVEAARVMQAERYRNIGPAASVTSMTGGRGGDGLTQSARRVRTNADASGPALDEASRMDEAARAMLVQAAQQLGLSARGYHRTVKVARTLADLEGADAIARNHIAEALSYRRETNAEREVA